MKPSQRATSVLAAAISGTLALAMAGCGQQVGGGGGATQEQGGAVQYWTAWPQDTPQAKIFAEAAKEFTAETGIGVDIRTLGGGSGQQDIMNAAATGTGPDIWDNAPDHLPGFRKANLIADLSGVMKATATGDDTTIGENYPQSVLKGASDDQGLAFLPHTVLSSGIWFDSATHPEFVTNPPATWDDLVATFADLKSKGEVPITIEGSASHYNILWFYWLMMRAKGAGSMYALSKSAEAWDDPAVLAAAQQVDAIRKAGYFQDGYAGSRYPNAQNAWAQGDYVFDFNGSWLAGEVLSVVPKDAKLTTFPFPTYTENSHPVQELNVLGWSISARSKNQENAKKFLVFLAQKKWADRIGSDAQNIPARADAVAPEALQAMQKAVLASKETTGSMDGSSAGAPTWFKDVLLVLDDQLVFGLLTPEQFIQQGKKMTQQYIDGGVS